MRDSLPLVNGAVPIGIIFGTLSGKAGLSAAGTIGMSLLVFAGSAQFIAIGLVGVGTAWPMIVLATFVVIFRHLEFVLDKPLLLRPGDSARIYWPPSLVVWPPLLCGSGG